MGEDEATADEATAFDSIRIPIKLCRDRKIAQKT
jgi:hypothetical protein